MRVRGKLRALGVAALAVLIVTMAAGAQGGGGGLLSGKLLAQLSQGVVTRYYAAHPSAAPGDLGAKLAKAGKSKKRTTGRSGCGSASDGNGNNSSGSRSTGGENNQGVFNCDVVGLPQNEESMTACPTNEDMALQGTNDYRGLVDPQGNSTGWHFSLDGGRTVTNEGLLPPVSLKSNPSRQVPSEGDPVDFLYADGAGCHAFAASLAFDPATLDPNGVAVYRSEPGILASCPGGSDPSCWPVRKLIVENGPNQMIDKEWMFVGNQAGVPYVWVTYTEFTTNGPGDRDFTAAIKAVRCNITLTTCTPAQPISTVDQDVQFSDVTIAPDGRAYITWSRVDGELEGTDQTFTHKIRVETAPGSGVFGPEHVIYAEDRAIPFGGFLQANDFRVATEPKNDVVMVGKPAHPRIFVTWDACKVRLLGNVCEYSEIKLSYSDDSGATWNGPFVISDGGVNYFPTISANRVEPTSASIAVAWFTNRYDRAFNNAQDVVVNVFDGSRNTFRTEGLKRLQSQSNEPEADPLLGGLFIGDYIETWLGKKANYTGYNANYRQTPLLATGLPVNQQDNYISRTGANG